MPGLDIENVYESDSSDNEENHSKLLSSVSQLDSTQRIKPAQRKELATHVSEYNLNKGYSNKSNLINVKELAKALGQKPEHGIITKKITDFTKKHKVLPKPLEKPLEERVKRSVGFEKVKKELGKWDAIVTRNALKDQISFPLGDNSMKLQESNEFLSQFKAPTPLEVEIAKVLKQEKKEEKIEDEFPLTYDEMLERRKEMAQLRARLSYKQTKAQRQSKIKSKKYHRLLKREKIRQQLKEFELLQKTDPEAALKKLAELDKTRAKERASLRHRNTGKWAKNLSVRAKYDVETRKVLADQLKMSRELTQKVSQLDVSEDEEVVEPVPSEKTDPAKNSTAQPKTDNPWMIDVSKEVQDFVNDYKNFWSENGEKINLNESQEKKKQCNGISESHDGSAVQSEKISINNEEVEKTQKQEISPEIENLKEMKISSEITEVKKQKENPKKAEISSKKTEISPKSINMKSKETNVSGKNKNNNSKTTDISPKKIGAKKTNINLEETEISPKKTKNNSVKTEAGPKKRVNSVEADFSCKKIENSAKKAKINSEKKEMSSKETETAFKKTKSDSKKTEVSPKGSKSNSGSLKATPEKSKITPIKEKTSVIAHPASGVWVVTAAPNESNSKPKKKRKANDIDVLFDELNEKLMNKAAKKIKRIETKLKKEEKREKVKKKKKEKKEFDLSLKIKNTVERPDLDVGLLEGEDENKLPEALPVCPMDIQQNEPDPSIDPKNFIQITPRRLNTGLPENITGGEDGVDNDKAQQMIIEEAFVDDDVVAEFNKMKEEEEKNEIQIDTSLPGWGTWGGTGIAKNTRKKPLVVFKIPSRKKKHLKDTIINENGNPNLKNHLVKEVPHPFKSVEAFEANIRAPVGRDWVPETAHRKLIEKQVVTKLGTVIEPMSEDEIVKLKKSVKSPFQGKKNSPIKK